MNSPTLARLTRIAIATAAAIFLSNPVSFSFAADEAEGGKESQLYVQSRHALFDGKSLDGWKKTDFGGEGEVEVEDGRLVLGFGQNLTGVTWVGEEGDSFQLPHENYEIKLEAMRADGSDFFCGLTFPIGDEFCSLILGGWGGGLIGISSIDGFDASENETTDYVEFKNKRWYEVRVRVTEKVLQAWLDGEKIVDIDRELRDFSVRLEVEPSRPLGIATWQTTGAIRNVVLNKLGPTPPSPPATKSDTTEKPAATQQSQGQACRIPRCSTLRKCPQVSRCRLLRPWRTWRRRR